MALTQGKMENATDLLTPRMECRSLKEQEFLSIKHALPKTRLSHTILHENTSQDRHFAMQLATIKNRENMMASRHEMSRRYFVECQARKQRKWKREDEVRAASMNFPYLPASKTDHSRPASMMVVYKSPRYDEAEDDMETAKALRGGGSLLPHMELRRERTEILDHKNKTYMTRLPTIIQIDPEKYEEYSKYCGTEYTKLGAPVSDDRFNQLKEYLAPPGGYVVEEPPPEPPEDINNDDDIPNDAGKFGVKRGISLALPPLMMGGPSATSPPSGITREMSLPHTEKERQEAAQRRRRSVISTKLKRRQSQASMAPSRKASVSQEVAAKDRRNSKDVTEKLAPNAEPSNQRKTFKKADRVVLSRGGEGTSKTRFKSPTHRKQFAVENVKVSDN